jgi:5'-3' exonuclease
MREGYSVVVADSEWEADDLLYSISRNKQHNYSIFSGDKDLALCVADNVEVFLFEKQVKLFVRAQEYIYYKFQIPLRHLQIYLATVGDPADGWGGIKGFGHKSFHKMLANNNGEIDYCYLQSLCDSAWLDNAMWVVKPCLIYVNPEEGL